MKNSQPTLPVYLRLLAAWMTGIRRSALLLFSLGSIIFYSGCGDATTAPSLSARYVLPKPVILDASPAGKIVLVYSALTFNPDNTWTGRDTVINTEADSGIPREFTGSGTYSISDSTLVLRSANGVTTNFDVLSQREVLRSLSTFGRVLLYTRAGSATQ